MPPHLLDDGPVRGFALESLIRVFVIDIVADTDELAVFVTAAEEDDGDADDFAIRDAGEVGRIGLEGELVGADGDGADEDGIELLVVFVAVMGGPD